MAKLSKILKSKPSNKLGLVRKPDGSLSTLPEESLETMVSKHFPGSIVTDNPTVLPQREDKELVDQCPGLLHKGPLLQSIHLAPIRLAAQTNSNQHLPREAVEALSNIFTAVIQLGYVPARWRTSDIIFIDKPGKTDLENPRSYRPISLMSLKRWLQWTWKKMHLKTTHCMRTNLAL
jgi:hypothetical protein